MEMLGRVLYGVRELAAIQAKYLQQRNLQECVLRLNVLNVLHVAAGEAQSLEGVQALGRMTIVSYSVWKIFYG